MFGRAPKKSDDTRYYEILGVSKNASQDDLKKACWKVAIELHPDKGGDPAKFKELAQAYEGVAAEAEGKRRGEDVVLPLQVSLEDLYLGTTKKLPISRNVICSKCNGKGSICPQCKGHCPQCKENCPQCKGKKVVPEKKVLEVTVEKGMQNGQKITFPGEADEAPCTITGDIVVVLQQKEHPRFKRKGDDLSVEHTLSLSEALCGFQFVLTHLDGRQLPIKSDPGEVVMPGSFKVINNEGMPVYQKPSMKGKLYIRFIVGKGPFEESFLKDLDPNVTYKSQPPFLC